MLCPLSPLEVPLSDTWEAFFPKGSQNLEFKDLLKKSPYIILFFKCLEIVYHVLGDTERQRWKKKCHKTNTHIATKIHKVYRGYTK